MTTFNQLIQQYSTEVSNLDTSVNNNVSTNNNQNDVSTNDRTIRLNNAMIAKLLEDRIIEHCRKYNNEQSQDLMNDIQKDLHDVRLQIFGGNNYDI
tara:strand:+ start:85 stop:372 length:288 start_codon:yes stop_codon:yes gene_type:complete